MHNNQDDSSSAHGLSGVALKTGVRAPSSRCPSCRIDRCASHPHLNWARRLPGRASLRAAISIRSMNCGPWSRTRASSGPAPTLHSALSSVVAATIARMTGQVSSGSSASRFHNRSKPTPYCHGRFGHGARRSARDARAPLGSCAQNAGLRAAEASANGRVHCRIGVPPACSVGLARNARGRTRATLHPQSGRRASGPATPRSALVSSPPSVTSSNKAWSTCSSVTRSSPSPGEESAANRADFRSSSFKKAALTPCVRPFDRQLAHPYRVGLRAAAPA